MFPPLLSAPNSALPQVTTDPASAARSACDMLQPNEFGTQRRVASLRKELISMARLDLPLQKKVLANAEDLAISETRHCTAP